MAEKVFAIVRVRGRVGTKGIVNDALRMLHLTRVNHCALADASKSLAGTLQLCKDYVTWGEPDAKTMAALIEKRGRLPGNKRITKEVLAKAGIGSFDKLASAILAGDGQAAEKLGMKQVFRLNPPSGGYRYTKKHYPKGALGYRGEKVNELLRSMM